MSNLLTWNDKINSPALADFIAKYGAQYCMTAEEINEMRDAVNTMAVVQQSTFMGTVIPAATPTGIGNRFWFTVTPGTYTNHGGVVVSANSLAIISVIGAVWSISQTALSLAEYASKAFTSRSNILKVGLKNPDEFLVSDIANQAASAIVSLDVYMRDDLVAASDVRITVIRNNSGDQTTVVVKDFTTGVNVSYINATGNTIGVKEFDVINAGKEIRIVGKIDLNKIPSIFNFNQNNNTLSGKFIPKTFLEAEQIESGFAKILKNDFGVLNYESLDYRMKQALAKLTSIEIWVDSTLLNDEIRLIGMSNKSVDNYHLIIKNYTKNTTTSFARLTTPPTVPSQFDFVSSDGKIRVFGVLDFSKLLTTESFYIDNVSNSIKFILKEQNAFGKVHIANLANPHQVTKAQVGLPNVDNTSDALKPLSNAAVAANAVVVAQINAVSTGLIYKTPVATFANLASTYPSPSNGWAAMVIDEGFIYSYNGTAWANTGIKQQQALSSIITIASADASADVKNRCHYVCDGTDDDVQINAAIQSLAARGGKIQLTSGRFYIANSIVIDKAITLIGEGTGLAGRNVGNLYGKLEGITTLRASADVDVLKLDATTKIQGIKLSDFLVQGFGKDVSTKIGLYFKTASDVLSIHNVNVTDCGIGIFANECDACNITSSSFQWNALGGIIYGGIYPNINNCCFADNNGVSTVTVNGVTYTVNTGGLAIKSFRSSIIGSTFVRNDRTGTPYNSISVLGGVGCKILGNEINDQNGNGIGLIGDATGYAEATMIASNNITEYGKSLTAGKRNGIYILKGHMSQISGNFIGSGLGGTTAEYAVFEDRAVNTYTGASIVKDNVFYKVQNAGKVALSGTLSAATNNVNVDS